MANSRNIALLIGGGTALGLGLIYFTYNKYQSIPNSSTSERQTSVDSDSDIGSLPSSREPSIDNQSRTLSNESNSSTSTYGDFFSGGSKNKKTKKLRKTKKNKRKKLSRKNKK
jgi:hypothetical protein